MKLHAHPIAVMGAALSLGGLPALAAEEAHWSYGAEHGPGHWGEMKEDFAACRLGHEQSPIDIDSGKAQRAALDPIKFEYQPSPLKIIDNGHTVQVNYAPGSFITANGKRYELLQFHFHKPSEEKINGKPHAMVAHLVHKGGDGKLAVVAVLLDAGDENALLKTLWANLPKEKEKETTPGGVTIDAGSLLPAKRGYYTFNGSLTTPPCSEGVTWFVLKAPVQESKAQIAQFDKLYSANARPVQPLGSRVVKASD
jgi:carbonic anhydrase